MKSTKTRANDTITIPSISFVARLKEGILIALVATCVYLLMALFTYSPTDPGWSHTGNGQPVQNAVGASGAWFADLLLSLFGYFAFLFPLLLAIKAWQVFRFRHRPVEFNGLLWTLRALGLIVTVATGASLASLHFAMPAAEQLPASSGGILGTVIIKHTLPAFNVIGSTLVLVTCFLVGVTVFTDLSWLRLMDVTGRVVLDFLALVVHGCKLAWKRRPKFEKKAVMEQPVKPKRKRKKRQEPEFDGDIEDNIDEVGEGSKRSPILISPPTQAVTPASAPQPKSQKRRNVQYAGQVSGDMPAATLLDEPDATNRKGFSEEDLETLSELLEVKLKDFNVVAEVVAVHPGPVITRFEIQPAPGVKVSKITNLAKDLARSLAVVSVRVVEVIPGKSVVGIEIPNEDREIVYFGEVINSKAYQASDSPLSLALGHDISGQAVVVNLAKMPHLLVAGTTGSGKSVGVNSMLLSMLFKASPEELRLIMVDPKMLELSIYEGIPHLLAPVVTDMKEASNALRWCVAEMERRYKLMAKLGVRNIAGFNRKVKDAIKSGEPIPDPLHQPVSEDDHAPGLEALPFIVVVIDEFADMMMIVGKKVEELIARLAQKARAAGIHMILATQRPSVDVITGLIKANIPTRISFQVSSKIDSRTILDQGGAEQLLGHGDMLYLPPGTGVPIRVHGAFVSDDEVHRVVADWKARSEPDYLEEVLQGGDADVPGIAAENSDDSEQDPLYDEAVAFVTESRRASISSVQRRLKIGYNRAARMIEAMEAAGVVSPMGSNGSREVIAPAPVTD
ncbi:DNA translocase FtsK [Spartinivicinus poritis]|uniref:DNA translocase FtsK n=1 Tax=Spartinivicinus poritis TaxID=2994640 RepID=A0ABT5U5J7_9GAMM|nr:DNA translocase FtsK 4TM domain-containing protein [Spartinivicinus sp. A2-2]